MQTGVFVSPEEVIHRALESLDAQEEWPQEHREVINQKIELELAQFEQGEGLTPETRWLAWNQRRPPGAMTNGVDEQLPTCT